MATTIELKRPVVVKVIMTGAFRDQMIVEANDTIKNIDTNLGVLEADVTRQIQNLEMQNPQQASILTEQWESEKTRQLKMKSELEWRIREIENVEDGAELPFRVFDGSVSLSVGDDFMAKMSRAEVVIKDWKILEIRGA